MKHAPNYRVFLLLTAVTTIGGGALVYIANTQMGDEQAKVEQLRGELKNEKELKTILADSEAKLRSTRERLAHLEKGVPDYAYLATMLKDLEVTGRKNGVQVLGVNSKIVPKPALAEGEKEVKKPYVEQLIEVNGRGSYREILNFVRALNTFPKIVETRCVNVQPRSRTDANGSLEMTIELRAFLFPDQKRTPDSKTAMSEGGRREG